MSNPVVTEHNQLVDALQTLQDDGSTENARAVATLIQDGMSARIDEVMDQFASAVDHRLADLLSAMAETLRTVWDERNENGEVE